jgi:hypothetical protein
MILKGDEQETVTVHTQKKIKRKRGKGETDASISSQNPKISCTGCRFSSTGD